MSNTENSTKLSPIGILIQILIAILNALSTMFGSTAKMVSVVIGK